MISVVIPVYNIERYIETCLKSLSEQTFRDFELILVNDGSTDSSPILAENFLKQSDLNWKIIHKENGGLASARNTGIRNSNGDYIVCIDGDDAVSQDFLEKLYLSLEEHDADLSFCAFAYVRKQIPPEDENSLTEVYDRDSFLYAFLQRRIAFVVPSMMFRKSFLIENQLFFEESIRFSEDQPFIWNVILHANKSVYLYKKMYGYYTRENSIMTSSSYEKIYNSYEEYDRYIQHLFSDYPEYQNISAMIMPRWNLGTLYTASKLLDYQDYKKIYDAMDGRNILKKIRGIHERNAYLLAFVSFLSPRLLYALCKRMDLNG